MERADVSELHFMTALVNVPSILRLGILSHDASRTVPHSSIASAAVQERRAKRTIPGGLRLHQYANLYLSARNAMMYLVLFNPDVTMRVPSDDLTVLRVRSEVLEEPGVVITDINAAADEEPRWHTAGEGLPRLNAGEIFAGSWNHGDFWEKIRRKQRMMAEVLVPHRVRPEFISGAYVASDASAVALSALAPTLALEVHPYMFFRGPRP